MPYSAPEIATLADEHKQIAYEAIQSLIPAFAAPQGSPTVAVTEGLSQLAAEIVAALMITAEQQVMIEAQLRGLDRYAAVAATATATITATDSSPHPVDAGDVYQVTANDGSVSFWAVRDAATITSSGVVTLVAQEPGAALNGVDGTVIAVQPKRAWIASVVLDGPADGGEDEESYPDFLARMGEEFIVGSNLIIKADQLAAKVQGLPGVGIALARRTYNPVGPDPAAPMHMTVAVANEAREDYPAIHAEIEALPTADCNTIHAVDFDRHPVAISATVRAREGWDPVVVKAQCEDALIAWVASWGRRQIGERQVAVVEDTVLLDKVAAVLNNQVGVERLDVFADLEIGVDGDPLAHADAALSGDFPLAYVDDPADIVVTVTT